MSWLRLMEESLQENVPEGAQGPKSENIHAPETSRKRGVATLIREMWPAYLIEILVIILGISITLALEEWRDDLKEERLEQVYLKNLMVDIKVDQTSLETTIAQTVKLLDRGNDLLLYTKNQNKIESGQLNRDIRDIISRPKFISNDATFSDLKNSGNLHLLKDVQLKNLLFAYYNQTQIIADVQGAEQMATITLTGPYFFKHFSLADSTSKENPTSQENMNEALNNIEFSNNVLLRLSNREELLDRYQKANSMALRLEDLLRKKANQTTQD
jgi:hypothetical protein